MSLPPCQSSDAELFSCAFFRFGIGRFTTEEEVDYTAEKCIHHVKRLREMRSALLYQRPFARNGSAGFSVVLTLLCSHSRKPKLLGF